MVRLGEALTETSDPPVKALFVYNSNPAAVAPDLERVHQGMSRSDLFVVVHEQFKTDTARYADLLLPATTQLEHADIHKAYGHLYMLWNEPSIAPLGEAIPNTELFRRLARRMGFQEPCFAQSDEEMAREVLRSDHPAMEGITLDGLKEHGWLRLHVGGDWAPFAEGNFPTPSGKCELWSESMAADGYDPLPSYTAPLESAERDPGLAARFPLTLLSPPAHHFLNTTFVNVLQRFEGEPVLEINPRDAAPRRIGEGDQVEVWNDRGAFKVRAVITERVQPGVVLAPSIWWRTLSSDNRNVNWTTSQAVTDMGGGATFYDNLVEVASVSEKTMHGSGT